MKKIIIALLVMATSIAGFASPQKVETSHLEVSDKKTVHLVFPKPVVYIDLGSHDILAGRVEWAENIVRVKAAVTGFETETTFSVMTADNTLYTFVVTFNRDPIKLNIVIGEMVHSKELLAAPAISLTRPVTTTPGEISEIIESIYKKDRKVSRKRGVRNNGLEFYLKGLYVHNDVLFFHLTVVNGTNIPFDKDLIRFIIADRKVSRRTPIQSVDLEQIASGGDPERVNAGNTSNYIIALPKVTIPDTRKLQIEIREKHGGRTLRFTLNNKNIFSARGN